MSRPATALCWLSGRIQLQRSQICHAWWYVIVNSITSMESLVHFMIHSMLDPCRHASSLIATVYKFEWRLFHHRTEKYCNWFVYHDLERFSILSYQQQELQQQQKLAAIMTYTVLQMWMRTMIMNLIAYNDHESDGDTRALINTVRWTDIVCVTFNSAPLRCSVNKRFWAQARVISHWTEICEDRWNWKLFFLIWDVHGLSKNTELDLYYYYYLDLYYLLQFKMRHQINKQTTNIRLYLYTGQNKVNEMKTKITWNGVTTGSLDWTTMHNKFLDFFIFRNFFFLDNVLSGTRHPKYRPHRRGRHSILRNVAVKRWHHMQR